MRVFVPSNTIRKRNPLQDGNLPKKEIRQASRGDRNAGG
jgi:hypothetical protein